MEIKELLNFEEGCRIKPYKCTAGYWTIGVGRNLEADPPTYDDLVRMSIDPDAIGNGIDSIVKYFNENPLNQYQVDYLLNNDILEVRGDINYNHRVDAVYQGLDRNRQIILESMCFQLGIAGLSEFRNMLRALYNTDWSEAYKEALDSEWYRNRHNGGTPERALRHATVLKTGSFDIYNGLIN